MQHLDLSEENMVKGVNRQIIEIRSTDSRYFERALLFVRAGQGVQPKEDLQLEAEKYLKTMEQDGTENLPKLLDAEYLGKNRRLRLAVVLLSAALMAAFVVCAVLLLVYTKM